MSNISGFQSSVANDVQYPQLFNHNMNTYCNFPISVNISRDVIINFNYGMLHSHLKKAKNI